MSREESSKRLTPVLYIVGLLTIFAADYVQYVVPNIGTVSGMLLVYGVPIVVVSFIWGRDILQRAFKNLFDSVKYAFSMYGIFTGIGLLSSVVMLYILLAFDPSSLNLLHKPNPVLNIPEEFAWVMVVVSVLIVGPSEEYLFRGHVYGGMLRLLGTSHWLLLALVSSILFAAAHLYYAVVYGVASSIQFIDLITFGMAMATTFYLSGGNLLLPALMHGAYDATGFLGVALQSDIGGILREIMLLIGLAMAIVMFNQRRRRGGRSIFQKDEDTAFS
jgi:membrane protease YdiL (CAAX protease family)